MCASVVFTYRTCKRICSNCLSPHRQPAVTVSSWRRIVSVWLLPTMTTLTNCAITHYGSCQNTSPHIYILSPGLLQFTSVWFTRQPDQEVAVGPECCGIAGMSHHWNSMMWTHHPDVMWVALPPVRQGVAKSLAWHTSHCLVRHLSISRQTSISDSGRHHLRSASDRRCVVSRTQNTFSDRSFCVAGPCVWNRLPGCLRSEDISYRQYIQTAAEIMSV